MSKLISFVFLTFGIYIGHSQISYTESETEMSYSIIRSNIGASGSSKTFITNNGRYIVSQSIGQSSVIGTSSINGYSLRQGYQQPSILADVIKGINGNELDATIYPNPFQYSIFITFGERITEDVEIDMFDVTGKLIYSKKSPPSQQLRFSITEISNGSYIINVRSSNKRISATLIKR